jgi:hypothetical protein
MSGLEAELVSIVQSIQGQFRGGETEQQTSQCFFRLCGGFIMVASCNVVELRHFLPL